MGSPRTSQSKSIELFDVEVWAPSWTVCQREDRAPDLFFKMKNEQSALGEAVAFNPVFLLAVAADQPEHVGNMGLEAATGLSEVCSALLRARRRRNWGYRLDHPERENAIQDYSPFGAGHATTGRSRWICSSGRGNRFSYRKHRVRNPHRLARHQPTGCAPTSEKPPMSQTVAPKKDVTRRPASILTVVRAFAYTVTPFHTFDTENKDVKPFPPLRVTPFHGRSPLLPAHSPFC